MLASRLDTELSAVAPDLSSAQRQAVRESVTAIFELSPQDRPPVMAAYISAVNSVFLIGVGAAALCSFGALFISRRRIKMEGNVVVA